MLEIKLNLKMKRKERKMFNWLTNKIIDGYIKNKIKEIKEIDIKKKLLEYVNEHKEEIIEKAKEAIDKLVKNLVAKIIEKFKGEDEA